MKLYDMARPSSGMLTLLLVSALNLSSRLVLLSAESRDWHISVGRALANDAGIQTALGDLETSAAKFGIQIAPLVEGGTLSRNLIVVGAPERNALTALLVQDHTISLQELGDPQSFEIASGVTKGRRVVVVTGGSVLGEVYGLYWIWDRLRVNGEIPVINISRKPELKIRFTGGASTNAISNALRYGATWVSGGQSVNDLIPWDVEPEKSQNAKNREEFRKIINYAHSLHLKVFVYEDEFSYHPSLLETFNATLNPADPAFWKAVEEKYRRLFKALPEIDGVKIRTGEFTRVGGDYRAFDVMHDGELCDWSLAKRYRTWVKKMHEVVVGEFGKTYYQRTWIPNAYEQHSVAAVYRQIFTDDVPVRGLYLSPYLSTTDRYFYQPYNPTFNQTPHNMVALLASLDYHSDGGAEIFPTFPGAYFQGGLKSILAAPKSNLKGVEFATPAHESSDTANVTAYVAARLAWNPQEDLQQIATDFAAIHFGRPAAKPMADMLMLSDNAYKYGIYIEPASYGEFSSLRHLRLTTFPAMGFPELDNGRKHIEFLKRIYFRCQPWLDETLLYLDHGLAVAQSMKEKFRKVEPLIADEDSAKRVQSSLELTYLLIKANNLYVKTCFKYFEYRDHPSADSKRALAKLTSSLASAMHEFSTSPGCHYRLDGMEQLLKNAHQALEDLPKAERILAEAPDDNGIEKRIRTQQTKELRVFEQHRSEAVKLLHWAGRIDGIDKLRVKGRQLKIEHVRYDPIQQMTYEFSAPLPGKAVTVIPVKGQSRSFDPFVLEQPSEKNNYTVTVYLSDFPEPGYSWWKFDLYYIAKSPEELGLQSPWQR